MNKIWPQKKNAFCKQTKICLFFLVLFLFCGGFAAAQDSGLGTGIILGEPMGINAKLWISDFFAIDAAAGWSFYRSTGDGQQVKGAYYFHLGYMRHFYDIVEADTGKFAFFVGLGGKAAFRDEPFWAVRIPIGLTYMFENDPIDIFIEVVPSIVLYPGIDSDMGGYVGIRYWIW